MKKVSLTLIVTAVAMVNSFAQIDKGQKFLGGNLSFTNISIVHDTEPENTTKGFQATVTPQLGFGVGNNWIVGAIAGFSYAQQKDKDDSRETLTDLRAYSIGLFARKFRSFSDIFGVFGEARAEYGFGNGERQSSGIKTKVTSYGASIIPGLYFKPGKKIIIESTFGVLSYMHQKEDRNDSFVDTKTNELNLSIIDGLAFGLKFIL